MECLVNQGWKDGGEKEGWLADERKIQGIMVTRRREKTMIPCKIDEIKDGWIKSIDRQIGSNGSDIVLKSAEEGKKEGTREEKGKR